MTAVQRIKAIVHLALLISTASWISLVLSIFADEISDILELPKSTTTDGAREHDGYYSLKMHREGPNTESGELDPKTKSNGVRRHNEDMANRYDKR
jgi:hypothetical protein